MLLRPGRIQIFLTAFRWAPVGRHSVFFDLFLVISGEMLLGCRYQRGINDMAPPGPHSRAAGFAARLPRTALRHRLRQYGFQSARWWCGQADVRHPAGRRNINSCGDPEAGIPSISSERLYRRFKARMRIMTSVG